MADTQPSAEQVPSRLPNLNRRLTKRENRLVLGIFLVFFGVMAFVVLCPFLLVAAGSHEFELSMSVFDENGQPLVAQVRILDDKGEPAYHFPVQEFTTEGSLKTDVTGKLVLHSQIYGYCYTQSIAGLRLKTESDRVLEVSCPGYQPVSMSISKMSEGRGRGQKAVGKTKWTISGRRPGGLSSNPPSETQSDAWEIAVRLER